MSRLDPENMDDVALLKTMGFTLMNPDHMAEQRTRRSLRLINDAEGKLYLQRKREQEIEREKILEEMRLLG